MPTWSAQQTAIIDWFKNGAGNLIVRARAGTGKTTTCVAGVNEAPERNILMAAFNKRNATDLQAKMSNPAVECKTWHALGFSLVARFWRGARVDEKRGRRVAEAVCGPRCPDEIIALVAKLASHGKNVLPLVSHPADLEPVAAQFDIDPGAEWEVQGWDMERVCTLALQAMEHAAETKDGSIDFDDMVYLPVRNGWANPKYDLVVIDEAQDTNPVCLMLALKVVKAGGRTVVVGDDRQAIYKFRGADSEALDRLKVELIAAELPLTITYRCPRAVVAEAALLVPDYEAAPQAPQGTVEKLPLAKLEQAVRPGNAVLSRRNAPLMGIALRLLKQGVPAKVLGRDIGRGLVVLSKKIGGRSIPDFLKRLAAWEERSVKRLLAAKQENKAGDIEDQAEALRVLVQGLSGLGELEARIEGLFADESPKAVVTCSSVHKAKGMEWGKVFILKNTLKNGKATTGEEANIAYVATTRAQETLVYVEGEV